MVVWYVKKTTQQKERSNKIWDWNSLICYFSITMHWQIDHHLLRLVFFCSLFPTIKRSKSNHVENRLPPTKDLNPLALRKGQNFRALKMWAGYGDIQIYLQLKTRFDIGKMLRTSQLARGEKTSSDSIYQLLGWPPWRYAYIMWWAPKGFFRGYVSFLPETSNLFEGERWWESGDASRKNRAMSSQNGSLKWLVFSLFLCQSGLVNSDDNLTGSTFEVGEADAMIFWR